MSSGLSAEVLRGAMALYLEALEEHREELDSLNVFPVPDGDTGTNLVLTQRAVERALRAREARPDADPGRHRDRPGVGATIASSALRAARGNSGVILAQVLEPLADALARDRDGDGAALATALSRASRAAFRAVAKPKEGTVLTVLRAAAAAGEEAAGRGADPAGVADAALRAARGALARTPQSLPELARAGVVDAGGLGIVLLLDSLRAAIRGEARTVGVGPFGPVGATDEPARGAPARTHPGFEVRFVISADAEHVATLSQELAMMGDSLTMAQSGDAYAVHVHTDQPELALASGRRAGRLTEGSARPLVPRDVGSTRGG